MITDPVFTLLGFTNEALRFGDNLIELQGLTGYLNSKGTVYGYLNG
jgi:hypothetical protein